MFRGAREEIGGPYSYIALVKSLLRIGTVKTVKSYNIINNNTSYSDYTGIRYINRRSTNYTVFKSPNTRVKVTVSAIVKRIRGEAWGVYLYKYVNYESPDKLPEYVTSNKIYKRAKRGHYDGFTNVSLGKAEEVYNKGEEIMIGVSYDGALSGGTVTNSIKDLNNNSKINIQIQIEAH